MSNLFCSYKYHKIVNYLVFEQVKKEIVVSSQRMKVLFTQKIVTQLSKIWVYDPGSRGQKGTGPRIRTLIEAQLGIMTFLTVQLVCYFMVLTDGEEHGIWYSQTLYTGFMI